MNSRIVSAPTLFLALTALGCASSAVPKQPPGVPPTPASVTRKNPGGDASDPERAALERLAAQPFGVKGDRWRTLKVALTDSKNWRRVRLWGYPMRASFRYGDDHHAVATVYYQKAEAGDDPASCLEQFLRFGTEVARKFDVKLGEPRRLGAVQGVGEDARPMLFQVMDGSIDSLIASDDYVGAVAAYTSWPGTCLVQGFAVVSTEHRELAIKIRDRWLSEGAGELLWDPSLEDAPGFQAR